MSNDIHRPSAHPLKAGSANRTSAPYTVPQKPAKSAKPAAVPKSTEPAKDENPDAGKGTENGGTGTGAGE